MLETAIRDAPGAGSATNNIEWESNMPDVFISYSHKDGDYAHKLAQALRSQQLDVWIDDRIDYGEHWPRVIQENLTSCHIFIVVMSTNAFNSTWVQNEVSFAQASDKVIFPLLLEGRVWLSMAAMQYVDVRGGSMPPQKFADRLKAALRQPGSPAAQPKVEAPVRARPRTSNLLPVFFIGGALLLAAVVGMALLYTLLRPGGILAPPASPTPERRTVLPTEPPVTDKPPTQPPTEPPVTDEPPTETPTEPPPTDVYAPNPLGPQFSEMGFAAEACYDLDVLFTSNDSNCDLYLPASVGLLRPVNGAQVSGHANMEPPSLNTCRAATFTDDPVGLQTDIYVCFLTNAGKYGFFVARKYGNGGIVFDAYVFP